MTMSGILSQFVSGNDADDSSSKSPDTTPGGNAEIKWEIVARTAGLAPATIMAGRLQAEGVPTRAWQEGAGRALGLTVGILGTGYVAVPSEYASRARDILNLDREVLEEEFEEDDYTLADDEGVD